MRVRNQRERQQTGEITQAQAKRLIEAAQIAIQLARQRTVPVQDIVNTLQEAIPKRFRD